MDKKTVKDLMLPLDEYATISHDSTIQEALVALNKAQLALTYDRHRHRAVLVLDDSGKIVGKLSQWAILRSLEPKYLNNDDISSLSRTGLTDEFIQSLRDSLSLFTGSLQQMCREAAKIRVKDAMIPTVESIHESAPLSEAIHRFVLSHTQSMIVTRKREVVGVLRLSDTFSEVADTIQEKKKG